VLPRQRLAPAFFVFHVTGNEGHDVIEPDEVDLSNVGDDFLDLVAARVGIERLEILDVGVTECIEACRNGAQSASLVDETLFEKSEGHLSVDVKHPAVSAPFPWQKALAVSYRPAHRDAKQSFAEPSRRGQQNATSRGQPASEDEVRVR
jgi:hypothetical protein